MTQGHCWGTWRPHKHLSLKNVTNAALCLFVFVLWGLTVSQLSVIVDHFPVLQSLIHHPLSYITLLLFVHVSFLFWITGMIQRSFWLIDPFWTWIPFMIIYAYVHHPNVMAIERNTRFLVILTLLTIWSIRLTHSYFRREKWKFGEREDWRYSMIAKNCGHHWWWISFWAVGVTQQVMLTGLTLPIYAVLFHPGSASWTSLDFIATILSFVGILIAFSADNALYQFTTAPQKPSGILRIGVWKYSRHPNYFGEQLFWWSLCLFAFGHRQYWTVIGPLFNTIIFIPSTQMTESRMLKHWPQQRAVLYRKYQKTTSVWIPWFTSWKD